MCLPCFYKPSRRTVHKLGRTYMHRAIEERERTIHRHIILAPTHILHRYTYSLSLLLYRKAALSTDVCTYYITLRELFAPNPLKHTALAVEEASVQEAPLGT